MADSISSVALRGVAGDAGHVGNEAAVVAHANTGSSKTNRRNCMVNNDVRNTYNTS